LQFDEERGYGFIAADDGGEDVFLHASVFNGERGIIIPGLRVEFQTMAGDRGRKAYAVHLIEEHSAAAGRAPAGRGSANGAPAERHAAEGSAVAPPESLVPESGTESEVPNPGEEEGMCDVLSEAEFGQEITSLLLESVPDLTGHQIVQVRRDMIQFGRKRGWIDA
jgi:CspA family cold shock protein